MGYREKLTVYLDGQTTAKEIKEQLTKVVKQGTKAGGRSPGLGIIMAGDNAASQTYVQNKRKACEEVGIITRYFQLSGECKEWEILDAIKEFNEDNELDGVIVQLPLPKQIHYHKIINALNFRKDVDGFHPINVGRLQLDMSCYIPATPRGIVELLRKYKIDTTGCHCVILGRSDLVGSPMATLLKRKSPQGNCTVTICHSISKNIKEHCLQADMIICAMGVPGFLKGDMVKKGAIVIDVGTTRVPSKDTKSGFRLQGDVLFEEVSPKCSYITPVPGGVGPMTVVSLLQNTVLAWQKAVYPDDND